MSKPTNGELYPSGRDEFDAGTRAFFCQALQTLTESRVPFLVGGGYAFGCYTGIERHTRDLDIFVRRRDCHRILEVLSLAGCRTALVFPHWLGKAFHGEEFIDVIFSSGNGIAEVDDGWFEHALEGEILGQRVRFCPLEETIRASGSPCSTMPPFGRPWRASRRRSFPSWAPAGWRSR